MTDIAKRLEQIETDIEYSDVAHVCGKAADEIERLRAELAAERERADAHYRALENVTAKKERLRAERDAAVARAEANGRAASVRQSHIDDLQKMLDALTAERDALRELLLEARRDWIPHNTGLHYVARIDAALKGAGDE